MNADTHALISQQYQTIEALRTQPMGGMDYCQKWVPTFYGVYPGESGFKSKCLAELSRVTGTQPDTIRATWGTNFEKTPSYAALLLRTTDLLNQVIVGIRLPPNFPN
ncbi:hypothetical protein NIES2135_61640 (plasmid) [Leptolyngbya boryana NIES-2135]|jgi:hypothetical protein|uniref:Uncharacterized protein n=1 Tax=Leptolyngbya boryana NIES-2135 TaxID=1973484 RepID=A0A1Z4JRJ5_LEPBY|nr:MULTISPECIES: hypothetical protein [Leptolyngbya]BAY59287.1 hypothetical protein NIES2135_61640 [Leptolyngbya boryana NIES-2135]MBD2372875.1 hypothetical protein [Leptolyngbya sp. FACHB-238]MBD2397372.1 hypothetical protein [Leptolyngbya sp. FACHB-239]MBD2403823.1 hypothetical protein [Leptolyngbya sp. FACHB-402]ULP33479.1 hypothetical protein MCP04_30585 [Leptolyngbya boryana IU 594]